MRKRLVFIIVMTAFLIFMAACDDNAENSAENADVNYAENNNNNANTNEMEMNSDNDNIEMDQETEQADDKSEEAADGESGSDGNRATAEPDSDRMVIYTADMFITVGDFHKVQGNVQSLVDEAEGYIVNSSVSSGEDSNRQGQITVRVPQEAFNDFIEQIEGFADEVNESNVNGEDVTKEYVDLESRLKAKKEVKKRLEKLLDKAEDSDDLLDISNKLGDTQEEIEGIKGNMEYLENHTAMSTVSINMTEKGVDAGSVKKWEDLNTWQKTKKVLVGSTNAIITFFSAIVIFLVGSSPILVPIIVIATVIFWVYRKRKTRHK